MTVWNGRCKCNYCEIDLTTAKPLPGEADVYLYDFVTLRGPWAVGCKIHYHEHRRYNVLGTGKGQEYRRGDDGIFTKTRG